jgi:excisionase family DNA binding protein
MCDPCLAADLTNRPIGQRGVWAGRLMLIGADGPGVVLSPRTAAWLERYAGLTGLRIRVRGTDPQISTELEDLRVAAMSWRASATGTGIAHSAELAPRSEWLNTVQAGHLLEVSDRAIRMAIARSALQATRVGGAWRIAREDIEHYRAARAA